MKIAEKSNKLCAKLHKRAVLWPVFNPTIKARPKWYAKTVIWNIYQIWQYLHWNYKKITIKKVNSILLTVSQVFEYLHKSHFINLFSNYGWSPRMEKIPVTEVSVWLGQDCIKIGLEVPEKGLRFICLESEVTINIYKESFYLGVCCLHHSRIRHTNNVRKSKED